VEDILTERPLGTLNHITFLMRCKSLGIVPKGLSVKMPYSGRRSFKIAQRAVWHSLEIGFTLIGIISLPNFRRSNN
jgi:hypothetical protein